MKITLFLLVSSHIIFAVTFEPNDDTCNYLSKYLSNPCDTRSIYQEEYSYFEFRVYLLEKLPNQG